MPGEKQKKVLFVDDSVEFLEIFTQAMELHSQGEWQVFKVHDAGRALAFLSENTVNLVVVDAQMPLLDGLQLIKLIGMKYPHLPKAVLTGSPNPNDRAVSLTNGADLYLEKPTSPEGMAMIYSTLNELAKVEQQEEGFQGTLRRVGLNDIIQMECLGRNSSVLEVFNKEVRGDIFIKNGSIIHALTNNDIAGQAAFYHLLSIAGGGFKIKPFVAPEEITITMSWEHLLMEAAHRRDETRTFAKPEAVAPSPTQSFENTAETQGDGTTIFIRKIKVPTIRFPRPKREPVQVAEMAAFSAQGNVLYEWQCPDVAMRKRFLDLVSEKSKQIAKGLDLGAFSVLEMYSPRVRYVAQIQEDAGVYVASYKLSAFATDKTEAA